MSIKEKYESVQSWVENTSKEDLDTIMYRSCYDEKSNLYKIKEYVEFYRELLDVFIKFKDCQDLIFGNKILNLKDFSKYMQPLVVDESKWVREFWKNITHENILEIVGDQDLCELTDCHDPYEKLGISHKSIPAFFNYLYYTMGIKTHNELRNAKFIYNSSQLMEDNLRYFFPPEFDFPEEKACSDVIEEIYQKEIIEQENIFSRNIQEIIKQCTRIPNINKRIELLKLAESSK